MARGPFILRRGQIRIVAAWGFISVAAGSLAFAHASADSTATSFWFAAPHVGDAGAYHETWTDADDPVARLRFEWLPPAQRLDREGRPVVAWPLRLSTTTPGETPTFVDILYGPPGDPPLAVESRLEDNHPRIRTDVFSRDYDPPAAFPCLVHARSGKRVGLDEPIDLGATCAWGGAVLGPGAFNGTRHWQGHSVVELRHPRAVTWWAPGVAYPVRILLDAATPTQPVREFELQWLLRGSHQPAPNLGAGPPRAQGLTWTSADRWGLLEAGVDHPFPFSAAFRYAREDPGAPRLRSFVDANPDAYLAFAHFAEAQRWNEAGAQDLVERTWTFVVTNGRDRVDVSLMRRETTLQGPAAAPGLVRHTQTSYVYGNETAQVLFPYHTLLAPSALAPKRLPTVASLLARSKGFLDPPGLETTNPAWGLEVSCTQDCLAPTVRYHATRHVLIMSRTAVAGLGPGRGLAGEYVRATFDEHGDARRLDGFLVDGRENQTLMGALSASPGLPQANLPLEGRGIPLGAAPAWIAAGTAAVLLAWPWVKALPALPLFSRLRRPEALQHPTRLRIHEQVSQEPGIHLRELCRRLGVPRTVVRHHAAALCRLGILGVVRRGRYACYYPRATTRWSLAQAAPVLRPAGARKILLATLASPGITATALAAATGLSAATVTYHVQRLSAVGMAHVRRQGRNVRIEPTQEALLVARR